MNKRRLLKLADLLEKDAKNKRGIKFDLDTWGKITDPSKPMSCGTTACAMGLAALSGVFKRAGLSAERAHDSTRLDVSFKGTQGFDAGALLFGIGRDESEFLFCPDNYRGFQTGAKGERFVAKRIRDFVSGKARAER